MTINPVKLVAKAVVGIILFIIVVANWPLVTVKAGTRGLLFNFDAIQETTLDQGLHFRAPWQRIEAITTQPVQLSHEIPVNAAGAITKDNQTIGVSTVLFYRYDENRLVEVRKDWGADKITSQLQSALNESFKEIIGAYTIFDIASRQEELRGKVWDRISQKVRDQNYPVNLSELRIQNYDWSDAFDAQINATMQAAQQVKKAEQELMLTEQQAQKKVKEAEADKAALIAQAEGEKAAAALRAEAKALEGEGIRKYNLAVQANMELEVKLRQLEIEMELAKRWNGQKVPDQVFSPIPFSSGFITK